MACGTSRASSVVVMEGVAIQRKMGKSVSFSPSPRVEKRAEVIADSRIWRFFNSLLIREMTVCETWLRCVLNTPWAALVGI